MHKEIPFQYDRPVFFRVDTFAAGRQYEAGDEFKWKEIGVDDKKVMILYRERILHHNAELEIQRKVGDGLEELDIDGLHAVVDNINKKVKLRSPHLTEYEKKKCKKSKIVDKQRGLIRSWRRNYGNLEVD